MFNAEKLVNDFIQKYRNKAFAVKNWKELQMKPFTVKNILLCIANAANGDLQEMVNIVDHLTEKRKVQGRSQVYADMPLTKIDIVQDANGNLELKGYDPNAELQKVGQHVRGANDKRFKKLPDGQTVEKGNVDISRRKLEDLGVKVREMYPDADNHFITFAMQAIKNFANQRKKNPLDVAKRIESGKYKLDTDTWEIIRESRENNKTIIINESDMNRLKDFLEMSEYKFNHNIRKFISQLLEDPVNAQPSELLKYHGYNRSKLLQHLVNNNIISRVEHISDKDENGEPKTATMMVRFKCPKKDFDRKLEKLFMRLFEKNLPPRKKNESVLHEDGCAGVGGATNTESSGQFVTKVFDKPVRRKMYTETMDESTTTSPADGDSVGQFTVPLGVKNKKDPSLSRVPGEVAMNGGFKK